MKTSHTTLKVNDGTTMQCYVSMPDAQGKYPGIILFQEAFGVNGHIRGVADRLAKEGYVVIAPELFHRTAPAGFEGSYTDFTALAPHFQGITVEGLGADSKAAYDWLQQQANVNHSKIGCIGFCLGGRTSFVANTVVPLSAAVSYYGGNTAALAERAKLIHGPHLFFWGGQDTHIPQEQIDTVMNAMKAANKSYTNVVISYAGHAFNCDERPSYNKQASAEAWAMTLAFFKNNLG
jgi:carboxymethylenebutenolidase